jgi:biotin operon repressor
MDKGFVKFHRKIHKWEWYTDSNTFHLFFHCITCANYEPKQWKGITVKRGQFVTGRRKLSAETGLTEQEIRTAIKKLKATNEIEVQSTNKYSIITVKNYELYQNSNQQINQQPNQQTTSRKPTITTRQQNRYQKSTSKSTSNLTTTKEIKEIKEIKNICINSSSSSICELPKISEEEEEILKSVSKKNKIKYFAPWLRKILTNGDYISILEEEKRKIERRKQREEQAKTQAQQEKEPELSAEERLKFLEEVKQKAGIINFPTKGKIKH